MNMILMLIFISSYHMAVVMVKLDNSSNFQKHSFFLMNIYTFHVTDFFAGVPLELAIMNRRLDVVKLMVKRGANPIAVPGLRSVKGVIPLMEEYYEFGTNEYIKWLFHEHLHPSEVEIFIQKVLQLDIFNDVAKTMFEQSGRHRAHALLTCGHEGMAKALLDHPKHGGSNLLNEKDAAEFTALQVAAYHGDMESVKVIMKL